MTNFNTGSVYMTDGIHNAIKEDKSYVNELVDCFEKYLICDWGDLEDDDKTANDDALLNNERILGAYKTSKGKIYFITEWDRSCTTLLFANEY